MVFGRSKLSTSQTQPLRPIAVWSQNEWCNQQVAGESYYEDALRAVLGPEVTSGIERMTLARLVPEPSNAHDRNAVAVQIDGQTVGYLPREDAARFQPMLSELGARGLVAETTCRVWGQNYSDWGYDARGRERQTERLSASVTLALPDPNLCFPINALPAEPVVMLPLGAAIQIQGEEECMDAIAGSLRPEGSAMAHVTLHQIEVQSGRASKSLVEVRIDGGRVGQLTPKMSGDLLPAIRHLESLGYLTGARAHVEGNRLKAEVVLHCARSHQLPPDWPGVGRAPTPAVQETVAPPAVPHVVSDPAIVDAVEAPVVQPTIHVSIPPKPKQIAFTVPPGWPPVQEGWEPYEGWTPDPSWPAAPAGWAFWQMVD